MNGMTNTQNNMDFTPVPRVFITDIVKQIKDADEISILLQAFNILYQKPNGSKFFKADDISFEDSERIRVSLDKGVGFGLFISMTNESDTIYILNNSNGKRLADDLKKNGYTTSELVIDDFSEPDIKPTIYVLYENNIGRLTPIIVEELKMASEEYPESWINEAFKEAVSLNKRNWKYIKAILQNWQTEGKKDGRMGTTGQSNAQHDPKRFLTGKYGSISRH